MFGVFMAASAAVPELAPSTCVGCEVKCAAPDGRSFVTATGGVWDVEHGVRRGMLDYVHSCTYRADSQEILAAGTHGLVVWSVANGSLRVLDSTATQSQAHWLPDGGVYTIRSRSIGFPGGSDNPTLQLPDSIATNVGASVLMPSRKVVYTVDERGVVRRHPLPSGRPRTVAELGGEGVDMRSSADGSRVVVSGRYGELLVFETGARPKVLFRGAIEPGAASAWSRHQQHLLGFVDNERVVTWLGGTVIWDLTRPWKRTSPATARRVEGVTGTPLGRDRFVYTTEAGIQVSEPGAEPARDDRVVVPRNPAPVYGARAHGDRLWVIGGTLLELDLARGTLADAGLVAVSDVAVSPDGSWLAVRDEPVGSEASLDDRFAASRLLLYRGGVAGTLVGSTGGGINAFAVTDAGELYSWDRWGAHVMLATGEVVDGPSLFSHSHAAVAHPDGGVIATRNCQTRWLDRSEVHWTAELCTSSLSLEVVGDVVRDDAGTVAARTGEAVDPVAASPEPSTDAWTVTWKGRTWMPLRGPDGAVGVAVREGDDAWEVPPAFRQAVRFVDPDDPLGPLGSPSDAAALP